MRGGIVVLLCFFLTNAFQISRRPPRHSAELLASSLSVKATDEYNNDDQVGVGVIVKGDRRSFLTSSFLVATTAAAAVVVAPRAANAGIDLSVLKSLPVEGDQAGAATRLRQIEASNNLASSSDVMDAVDLPDGVTYREYRQGRGGGAVVQAGSKVAVEMTIRCKSFTTPDEPGGVKYFSTKDDTDFNELAFQVASGAMFPELEEGMLGMRRGSIRRILVPSTAVFAAKAKNQLPLPRTKTGQRIFDRLVKTDATILIEVLVTRIN
jgi:hypothetical protein